MLGEFFENRWWMQLPARWTSSFFPECRCVRYVLSRSSASIARILVIPIFSSRGFQYYETFLECFYCFFIRFRYSHIRYVRIYLGIDFLQFFLECFLVSFAPIVIISQNHNFYFFAFFGKLVCCFPLHINTSRIFLN